jgi:hypothetical protein
MKKEAVPRLIAKSACAFLSLILKDYSNEIIQKNRVPKLAL